MKKNLALLFARSENSGIALNHLLRGGAGSFGVNIIHNLLTLGTTIVLARMLLPAGYGVYAYVYTLMSLLSIPAQFGLPPLIVRETARGQAKEQWGPVKGVFKWANRLSISLSIFLIAIAGLIALFFSQQFSTDQLLAFSWALVLMPILVLGNLRGAVLRGLRKVVWGQFPEKVIRPGMFIVLLVATAFFFGDWRLTAGSAMALHAVAATAAFAAGHWFLYRLSPVEMRTAVPSYDTKSWLATVLPLALTAGMHLVNMYADILMLGILTSAEEVGIYRVSVQGAVLVTFGISAIDLVAAPYIARLHTAGDRQGLQSIVTLSARIGAIFAVMFVLIYLACGDTLLSVLFGADYVAGWAALIILSTGRLFNAVMGPVVILLNMTGHERIMAKSIALATVINIVLNILLIPPYGMEGAALATMITVIVWSSLLWKASRYYLRIDSTIVGSRSWVAGKGHGE